MPIDAYRHADTYIVNVDLPGFDPSTIDISVEKDVLSIKAERHWQPMEGDEVVAAERTHGSFFRQLFLGAGLDTESVEFARIVEGCQLSFIGPRSDVMALWGDKLRARETARRFGLPLLQGSEALRDAAHAETEAMRVGFPVMVKARGGGGGRGMRVVRTREEVRRAFESATAEAMNAFKNPELYLERFIERPRHIEFQALADHHGQVWTLGERECSLQRRNQKLVEEAPSPNMTDELRAEMAESIRRAVSETGYTSLGTLEFLMDDDGKLFFMEMNTRVQVEHPVTEMTTGVDLVVEQIRAAAGEKLELGDTRPWRFRGHAIECRIQAEDPFTFAPWPGKITEYHPPGGIGIRVDSGIFGGWTVPAHYDSQLAKVISHAPTLDLVLNRMRLGLDEFLVGGIRSNFELQNRLLDLPVVIEGRMTTRTVENFMASLKASQS
jgi:acetyl-CoA carboxylase biotin carboxylase subunit